jgi:hypothetical protein
MIKTDQEARQGFSDGFRAGQRKRQGCYANGNICVAWKATRKTSLNPIAGTRVPQHQQLGLSADCCQARYDELVTIVQYEAMGDNVPAAHERRALVNPELECKVALD